jgi:hypothetical protein
MLGPSIRLGAGGGRQKKTAENQRQKEKNEAVVQA